ncbi:hypothetical protein [Henriciella litoralis]|uniref:hypothetical protein n=1 Tax=Henriciella litoralis TaxID=568102 RepID=UPI0009FF7A5F|nr:hypothetical protein [Henriciella litoralis]
MKSYILAGALALSIAPAAMADESWTTEIGRVVYDHDNALGQAVLTFPIAGSAQRGITFINGLAGETQNRGVYFGAWIEPDGSGAPACDFAIMDPETGTPHRTWGRVQMIFVDPAFPSSWVLRRGYCFDDYSEFLVGKPLIGQ